MARCFTHIDIQLESIRVNLLLQGNCKKIFAFLEKEREFTPQSKLKYEIITFY